MAQTGEPLRIWQRWLLAAAVVGVAICGAISWNRPEALWRAYLVGYMACWPVTLGAAGLLAIGNLTGGRWATAARPLYLAAARTIPLVAILFIPIALGIGQIYPWADGASRAEHAFPPGKSAYLSPTFFVWRAAGYLAVWLVIIGLLNYVSRLTVPPGGTPGMRRVGALALVLLVPTATFAAFDWAMSLEPEWYSSIYGAIVTAGGVLAAHALAICGLVASRESIGVVESVAAGDVDGHERATAVSEQSHSPSAAATESLAEERVEQLYNDLGNLLLAFLMVLGYLGFSQFLIIWSGNLPSEITWYLRRLNGGWQWLALGIALLGLVAFFQMLSRDRKRTPRSLAGVAAVVLAAYGLHAYWQIVPAFSDSGAAWQATNIAAIVALAGSWLAAFCWHANRCLDVSNRE